MAMYIYAWAEPWDATWELHEVLIKLMNLVLYFPHVTPCHYRVVYAFINHAY